METAWIKILVLSLAQCSTPVGKIICQEEMAEYQFANAEDCASPLVQMMDIASHVDNILIDWQESDCCPAVKASSIFASDADAQSSPRSNANVALPPDESSRTDDLQVAHNECLENTKTCDETAGVAPCRIGMIIVEPAAEAVHSNVWKQ
jgi:hypothetical protein